MSDYAEWLDLECELIVTTEGLKQEAVDKGLLRIAHYGSGGDYGETVKIGTEKDCYQYAISRGFQK